MAGIIAGIICIDVRDALQEGSHKLALGHDLLPSYVAGTFVREGRSRDMYDIDAVHREEARIVRSADLLIEKQGGPWLNPPFFASFFAPLSLLPYRVAAAMFLSMNLVLLSASIWLLCRQLPISGWRAALVPLLICTSMPFWQAICHQQNTFISLFLLSLTTTFWMGTGSIARSRYGSCLATRRGARPAAPYGPAPDSASTFSGHAPLRVAAKQVSIALLNPMPFAAGASAGLLFFKPQLALVIAIVLVATSGRRALWGILTTTSALLAFNLVTLPGTLGDYLIKLPPILHTLQFDPAYNWGRQDTLQSFWRLICEGHIGGPTQLLPKCLTWVGIATIGVFLGIQVRKVIRVRGNPGHDARQRRLIAATVLSMPLLMPYYMDYDVLLLAVPAVLFARDWLDRDTGSASRLDRWQLALWICLFFETQINPGLAGQTRLNLGVPILAALCATCLLRCQAGARAMEVPLLEERDTSPALAA